MVVKSEVISKDGAIQISNNETLRIYTIKIIDRFNHEQYLKVIIDDNDDLFDYNVRRQMIDGRIEHLIEDQKRNNYIFLGSLKKGFTRHYKIQNNISAQNYVDNNLDNFKAITRWQDTKEAFSKTLNPSKKQDIQKVIDALFYNIAYIYNDFCGEVPYVDATNEYKFNLFKPTGNPPKWDLMTFLLNRAITNVNGIYSYANSNGYEHSNEVLLINPTRYEKFKNNQPNDWIEKSYSKSKLHETGHALHVHPADDNSFRVQTRPTYSSDFDVKDKRFSFCSTENKYYTLISELYKRGINYSEILSPNDIQKANHQNKSVDGGKDPFGNHSIDEAATEYYATKYAGLYEREEFYKEYQFGYGLSIKVPNFDNYYSPYAVLIYLFENLISKQNMFNGLFMNDSNFLREFYIKHEDIISSLEQSTKLNFDRIIRFAFFYQNRSLENIKCYMYLYQLLLEIYIKEYHNGNISDEKITEIINKLKMFSFQIGNQSVPQLETLINLFQSKKNTN